MPQVRWWFPAPWSKSKKHMMQLAWILSCKQPTNFRSRWSSSMIWNFRSTGTWSKPCKIPKAIQLVPARQSVKPLAVWICASRTMEMAFKELWMTCRCSLRENKGRATFSSRIAISWARGRQMEDLDKEQVEQVVPRREQLRYLKWQTRSFFNLRISASTVTQRSGK